MSHSDSNALQNRSQNLASCLCGAIQFEVSAIMPLVAHCHCKMCQKFHGAAFSTFAEVRSQDIQWHAGREMLTHYEAENSSVRSFCKKCGSSLFFESRFNRVQDTIEVALAAFDQLETVYPDAHIFWQSKVEWFTPNDNLVRYLAYRNSEICRNT
ncbi:GFA family protein [Thalassotalea fusca]